MAERKRRRRRRRPVRKLTRKMRTKLLVLFCVLLIAFGGLIGRLMYIDYTSGDKYQKIVLAQQAYDNTVIPYQRGDIVDTNGTVLATSVAVYNVVLDGYQLNEDDGKYIEPTIDALVSCFPDLDREELAELAKDGDNRYMVLKKKLSYEEIQGFVELTDAADEKGNLLNPDIKGVWFEKEYQRTYPYKTLASAVLGIISDGNVGTSGLENSYDDVLNGTNGRQYGYLNSDSDFEKTVVEPKNGKTLVSTIDANIQSIVEDKLALFNETYQNNARDGYGSENSAVVIMNPNNGEILAMANYPGFDCNDPRNLSALYSEEEIADMTDEETLEILNKLWRNYCVSDTYEPGSVQKPFTVAAGIETGTLTTGLTFFCDGVETFADGSKVHCVNRSGHGTETIEEALMDSCNDALMQMSYLIGVDYFTDYQTDFGFGQKTGIDLPGEAYTASLIYTKDNMTKIDLATNAFGQNYNCTMTQMISAFSSLINGGSYYRPHVVKKITDSEGDTISTITPTLMRQTVSESTSNLIKGYLRSVVSDGTGNLAKVDGYSMGGKTGTAQKSSGGKKETGNYLVSFLGFAPYDDPQLVIYCVLDEPNVEDQAHSSYAQNVVREILKEVLPYMNIYPDEEQTGVNAGLDITGETPPGYTPAAGEAGDDTTTGEGTQDETVVPEDGTTGGEGTPEDSAQGGDTAPDGGGAAE